MTGTQPEDGYCSRKEQNFCLIICLLICFHLLHFFTSDYITLHSMPGVESLSANMTQSHHFFVLTRVIACKLVS